MNANFSTPFPRTAEYEEMAAKPSSQRAQLKKLHSLHREVIRFHAAGWRPVEIAKEMGITPATVSNVINSELGKVALEKAHERRDEMAIQIAAKLQAAAPHAIDTLTEVMHDEDSGPMARLKAADSVLDRAGYGAVKQVEVTKRESVYSRIEIEHIRNQAKQAAIEVQGEEIDGNPA